MRGFRNAVMLTVLVVLVAALGSSVLAAGSSGKQAIKRMTQRPDGIFLVWGSSGDWNNPDVCDDSSRIVLIPPDPGSPEADEFKQRYAMTLGAHLTGRMVVFRVNGCALIGTTSYPEADGVSVF